MDTMAKMINNNISKIVAWIIKNGINIETTEEMCYIED
jgi:hypothetical protein